MKKELLGIVNEMLLVTAARDSNVVGFTYNRNSTIPISSFLHGTMKIFASRGTPVFRKTGNYAQIVI